MSDDKSNDKTSAAARVRENQRRSRARRREFVESLQTRVQEYERRGVEATLEMQRIARAVALQNSRLRSLLTSAGVSNSEVERYLDSFHDDEDSGHEPTILPTGHHYPLELQLQHQPPGSPVEAQAKRTRDSSDGVAGIRRERASINCYADGYGSPSPPLTGMETSHRNGLYLLHDTLLMTQDRPPFSGMPTSKPARSGPSTQSSNDGREDPRTAPSDRYASWSANADHDRMSASSDSSPNANTSPMEMSCSVAASIIVSMQRGQDERRTREALGCQGTKECLVKNTMLFQFLDS
ncbi:hypothetical protein B0T24DRAFT_208359 [Lasiosphaeria ovina]|uniref:BZIP domain-containing protein n=1 Tax=Lasiosphaeria ovina TaxID=92902 RepID=A0AAE0KFQ2_9PEZI|nr:hypothetical protein B0T24DRAFT_208359 [Lasiosphaeria ovina]